MIKINSNIYLRQIDENDMQYLMELRNNSWVKQWFFSDVSITMESQKKWYKQYQANDKDILYLIMSDMQEKIGTVGIGDIDSVNKSVEFGRFVIPDEKWQGRGVGRQVVKRIMKYCFEEMYINRISLEAFEDNHRAVHLYSSCGFVSEGILREKVIKENRYRNLVLMAALRNNYENIAD
jgi:diamine N-acetyltransferase